MYFWDFFLVKNLQKLFFLLAVWNYYRVESILRSIITPYLQTPLPALYLLRLIYYNSLFYVWIQNEYTGKMWKVRRKILIPLLLDQILFLRLCTHTELNRINLKYAAKYELLSKNFGKHISRDWTLLENLQFSNDKN